MQRIKRILVLTFPIILAVAPAALLLLDRGGVEFLPIMVGLNFFAWGILIVALFSRDEIRKVVVKVARTIGIEIGPLSTDQALRKIIQEVERKNRAISMNFIADRIINHDEQSKALERIVALSYKLLNADSAEIALFDIASGVYHKSFVLGKPFQSSAQAMLSGAASGEKISVPDNVLVEPIAFAGSILGSVRVGLKKGTMPSQSDKEVIRLLALQSGLAIINSQYTDELVKMKRSSDESVKAKTGFLANLSHEIRGPLGIMLNAVEVVLDGLCGPVSDEQMDTLKMVRRNGEHLLELINDVLDYAKVESGVIKANKTDILVNDLLKDLTKVVQAQAEKKNHKLKFRPSQEALAFSCDKRHIRQILINLLTNAIKYTPAQGAIEVWAERIPGNKIKVNVQDNGIGIDPAQRHKVFAAFERVEDSYALTQMGTGLGMPLTKNLLRVNGGTIDFESAPGKGSHFWIIFPAIEYRAKNLHEEETQRVEIKGNGDVILLLEPEEGERNVTSRYLEKLGFKVIGLGSAAEAQLTPPPASVRIALISNSVVENPLEPQAWSIVESLRGKKGDRKLPIVMLSTRAFAFDIERYLRQGVDVCLVKPLELSKLGLICRDLIDGQATPDTIGSSGIDLNQEQQSNPQSDKTRSGRLIH